LEETAQIEADRSELKSQLDDARDELAKKEFTIQSPKDHATQILRFVSTGLDAARSQAAPLSQAPIALNIAASAPAL
jgi:hypothetical protein